MTRDDRNGGRVRSVAAGLALALCLSGATGAGETRSAEDAALQEQLESRLAAIPALESTSVRVDVSDGAVVLQGRVLLLEHSLRAEQTVWKTPGVEDVDNELRVVPSAAGSDAAIERAVRRVLESDGRFLDANLRIEVVAGTVRMRGMFQQPSDVLDLKHRVASIPGVLEVEIDALVVALRADPPLRP